MGNWPLCTSFAYLIGASGTIGWAAFKLVRPRLTRRLGCNRTRLEGIGNANLICVLLRSPKGQMSPAVAPYRRQHSAPPSLMRGPEINFPPRKFSLASRHQATLITFLLMPPDFLPLQGEEN